MNKDRLFTHLPLVFFFILIEIFGLYVLSKFLTGSEIVPLGLGSTSSDSYGIFDLILSFVFMIFIVLLLMKMQVVRIFRFWFLIVSILTSGITLSIFFADTSQGTLIAFSMALVLSSLKVFRPSVISHNLTEFLIYPGIAVLLVPFLNIPTTFALIFVICVYDIYAVWHSKLMQNMAKYQLEKVRVFSGILLPQFINSKGFFNPFKKGKKKKKMAVALLGGGDIIFPLLLAGVLIKSGFVDYAMFSIVGAMLGLLYLILRSENGKFYPAMPFIFVGNLVGLSIPYIYSVLL